MLVAFEAMSYPLLFHVHVAVENANAGVIKRQKQSNPWTCITEKASTQSREDEILIEW